MTVLNRVWAAVLLGAILMPHGLRAAPSACPRADALGVSRTVEIDTTGGPGFGFEHYKANDFLQPKEVVLTFDDGPQKYSTEMVLAALAEQCTKATFFSIGKMALGYPEIIREVAKAGHTIGTHTWSHQSLRKLKTIELGKDEIERGASAVKRAVGGYVAPFFRYPALEDTPESIAYLGKRNLAMFSTDIDSFDFKPQPAEHIVKHVMARLDKLGKGIVLMHDIHKTTAKALPMLLAELKAKGYKIVHMRAKGELKTVAEFDALIEKDAKGLPVVGTERPVTSIVKTIEGDVPPAEATKSAAPKADPQKAESAKPDPASKATPPADAKADASKAPAPAAQKAGEAAAPVLPEDDLADVPGGAPEGEISAAAQSHDTDAHETEAPAAGANEPRKVQTTAAITSTEGDASVSAQGNGEENAEAEKPAEKKKSGWIARAVAVWKSFFGN